MKGLGLQRKSSLGIWDPATIVESDNSDQEVETVQKKHNSIPQIFLEIDGERLSIPDSFEMERIHSNTTKFETSSTYAIEYLCVELTASLNSLGPLAWVKLSEEQDSIFETISVQSAANNVINLEVPLTSLNRALKSALNATSAHIRLTKKDNLPMLALTIVTTTSSNTYSAFPAATANNDDGFDAAFDNDFGAGNRETIVTQEIPVRVLPPDTVAHLHEPACREPDVHIILPPLMQLKSISDRFTKIALADTKSSSAASRTRLEVSANMHGCLKMSIKSDAMNISSVWTDLNNPELDPGHVAGGENGIAEHPSTRMKQLGSADGRSEEGWATVRIDGREWGKVMSVGRLGGRVIACFCHEHALILYVYLPNDNGDDESVLTTA
ncbi:cell cycle checkpoint protein (Hus1) [Pyrenophora tritici-repentis Pt-1C-BFP]|uniref:Cell cycle checkpoint protein (Hus1) n=1 Tax=Pyrenophora tritici-repentis (strain Pt-1C-BFP) TaxID=426418 RepID=B2W2D3_PYRTR|nr:cell cycle checkpoint protein (Hus1) [Pyrenophora tritici-repentis Pt-1C-BFP]EDU46419.1 cell cycle checkpoint protein (Hus1) [Pyrenophora tritici-repentis Pt-1C-BFP]